MNVGFSILVIFTASIALVKGVSLFVKAVSHLGHRLKISGYTISFLLVAIGTSLPEAVVAITSGLEKNTILSFGDAMGSNMALLTIVIAIPAILGKGISTRTALHSKDIYFTAMFSALPIALVVDGILSRVDGILLLIGYVLYVSIVLRRATGIENIIDTIEHPKLWKNVGMFVISLVVLLGASQLIVNTAISLSTQLGIGLGLIGLTLTAIGTSLPEIAFSIAAVRHHAKDEILGDIIGSVVANSTFVLGLAATIYPINVSASHIGVPTMFSMLLALLVFLRFSKTKEKLDTWEGIVLVFIYILFVATEIYVAS